MANYKAIAAVGMAIVNLLTDATRGSSDFGSAKFSLFQAADFTGNKLPSEGATVYLYRVTVNTSRRSLPPRVDANGNRFKPSLPLDLHFLITTWANDADKQLRLLGWIMRVIEDTPILPAALLNELEQNGSIFAPGESVELFLDPISLQDMSLLWENLKQVKVLPSITYTARMVFIDSQRQVVSGEPTQTRDMQYAEMP